MYSISFLNNWCLWKNQKSYHRSLSIRRSDLQVSVTLNADLRSLSWRKSLWTRRSISTQYLDSDRKEEDEVTYMHFALLFTVQLQEWLLTFLWFLGQTKPKHLLIRTIEISYNPKHLLIRTIEISYSPKHLIIRTIEISYNFTHNL